jgi:hypothetical protein
MSLINDKASTRLDYMSNTVDILYEAESVCTLEAPGFTFGYFFAHIFSFWYCILLNFFLFSFKQRATKHTYKTKDRVKRTTLKI